MAETLREEGIEATLWQEVTSRSDSNFDEKVVQVNRVSKNEGWHGKWLRRFVVGRPPRSSWRWPGKAPDVLSVFVRVLARPEAHADRSYGWFHHSSRLKSRMVLPHYARGSSWYGCDCWRSSWAVVEAAGIRIFLARFGTDNKASNVYTTYRFKEDAPDWT